MENIQKVAAINPIFGMKIRETWDTRKYAGFSTRELARVYADLISDSHTRGLVLESATFEEVDGWYNPGEADVDPDFILEAIVIDKFSRTERRMQAVCRVFRRALANSEIKILDPVVGKPKKQAALLM